MRSKVALRRVAPAVAVAFALAVGLAGPAPAQPEQTYAFQNPDLPLDTRIEDLLGRLTLEEKVSMLHQYQPAIPRLGIKSFKTGTEALHGVAWLGETTVFPQAVGLASTWDPELIKRVGSAVGDEARGFQQERPTGWGLNMWAPVVNLLRDPRWGRNEEGYSEDPLLTSAIAIAYGKGMQGDDPHYLKTAPTLKHYLANNNEVDRITTSSDLRPRVYKEYDEQAFKPAISADAATGVMTAYNLVNGRPATVTDLNSSVRTWTDKTLFNVTDADGPNNVPGSQNYYPDKPSANAAILKAGVDSYTNESADPSSTLKAVHQALDRGLITEKDVDNAVRHALSIRFRLGEFDPNGGPYGAIDKSVINSEQHQKLARTTAAESMVLLKNGKLKNGQQALPLDPKSTKKVAVVGPLENTLYTDWYSGSLPYGITPREGIQQRLGDGGTVTASEGVDRIALKNTATGKYITGGADADGAALKESAATAGATEQFDVFDWGQGVLTLRSAANGKVVGYDTGKDELANNQAQPNGWFVQQMFKLEKQPEGDYLLRYAGYETTESWFPRAGTYVAADADGTLRLVTKDKASRYAKDVVRSGIDEAVKAVKGADSAVVVVGSMPFINGREAHDRTDMNLAESQAELVKAVYKANPNTVMVLETSYPDTITWEQENLPAIVWTTHAGQETGRALADVLFGDVNPAGRLTQTWYKSVGDLPDILDYDIIKSDRTYLYYKGDPLYPFGHGLSYTQFRYGTPKLSAPAIGKNGKVTVTVPVTNSGKRDGDEVVQLYVHQRDSRDKQPVKELRAFEKVHLKAGQTKNVKLTLKAADLGHWDVTRDRMVVEDGRYDVMVGASAEDIRGRTTLRVHGEKIPARDLSKTTGAVNFDDYSGIRIVDETKTSGDAVGGTADGEWVSYRDADLKTGPKTFTARTAKESAGSGAVEIRLGGPNGKLLGTAEVPSTGDRYAYRTVTADLTAARGRHDVYLVFRGDLRISSFSLR
ncbi:glycoside hydrolase family 3 protein [Streptomyces capparidis]